MSKRKITALGENPKSVKGPPIHIYRAIRDGKVILELEIPGGTSHDKAWEAVLNA